MSLHIASLNSGSNGNAYYIGNASAAVLIDAGLSCREIEKRMAGLGLNIQKIKALFISHEHTDHIRGVDVLAKKYSLPVYISEPTYNKSRLRLPASQLNWISDSFSVNIEALDIVAFSKKHDAADPYSFTIQHEGTTIGVFTDIGIACDNLITHFKQCHAAFLESNYDEQMLENGRYPYVLKQRIRSGHGHLSNRQALEVFIQHRPSFMTHLLLSHLSKDNNDPELALKLFEPHALQTKVVVASRYEASELFYISSNGSKNKVMNRPQQMDLFAV